MTPPRLFNALAPIDFSTKLHLEKLEAVSHTMKLCLNLYKKSLKDSAPHESYTRAEACVRRDGLWCPPNSTPDEWLRAGLVRADVFLVLDSYVGNRYWKEFHQLNDVMERFALAAKIFTLNDDGHVDACYHRLQDHMTRLTPKLPDHDEWFEQILKRE